MKKEKEKKQSGNEKDLKRKLKAALATLSVYQKKFQIYRQKYWIQTSISVLLILALAVFLYQGPITKAAPTQDFKSITTQAQFDQGTFSSAVSQSISGGEVRLAGSAGPDNTQYKRTLTINNSSNSNTLTNYQVSLTLDTAALILASKMQGDCDDIRFKDADDSTNLDFWLDGPCNNASSKIWVEVPSIPASSSKSIYLYYGSGSAASQSSIANTFIREITGVIGAWTLDEASGNVADTSGNNYTGTPTGTTVDTGKFGNARNFAGNNNYITTSTAVGTAVAISMWVVDAVPPNPYGMLWRTGPNGAGPDAFFYNGKISLNTWNGDTNSFCTIPANAADGNFHHYVFNVATDTGNTNLYYDNSLCGAATYTNPAANNFTMSSGVAYDWYGKIDQTRVYSHTLTTGEIADLYSNYGYVTTNYPGKELIRKYSSPEPSTSVGIEAATLQSSGTWTSPSDANAIDVIWNGGWSDNGNGNALESSVTIPANTNIDFEMRLSTNRSSWTSWYDMTDEDANSGRYGVSAATLETQFPQSTYKTYRYLQVRATLTQTDGVSNPTLSDITIYYLKDVDPPSSNVTSAHCYTDSGMGTELTTDTWYNDDNIYCTWSGATDPDSGVAGYYVYFGLNNSADPEDDGSSHNEDNSTFSSLTSGNTYYLRLKAYDLVGNTVTTTYQGFIYKFDSTAPTSPGIAAADPAGYSNVNSFTFLWSAGSDDDSGIGEYCYKTGEEGFVETCISGTSVSGIESYQENVNVFYVRSKDEAGNLASSYAQVNYYYNGSAPSEPQDLAVDPAEPTSTNSFTFSWSAPAIYSGSIASYHYSINALPTALNTSTTTATSIGPGPYATQQGTNTFYIVAEDAAGNVNYNAYSSIEFTANTSAPGIPVGVIVTDTSNRAQDKFSLTVTWDEPENTGSGIDHYNVERSEDEGVNYSEISQVAGTGYLDTGLTQNAWYCYRIKAADNANAVSAASTAVCEQARGRYYVPPNLVGTPGVTTRIQSATVEWLTDREGSSFVEYGTATSYGEEQGQEDFVTSHEVTLIALEPDTTYHYRARWTDEDDNTGYSSDYTFTTADALSAPTNLAVTPEYNTENSFKFTWDPPLDEGVTVQGYFYSINSTPTEENVSYTTNEYVGPGPYATQQGTNTFYVVAIDEDNNINYSNYASIDFEAETEAPSIPTGLIITDSSNREAEIYSITLVWEQVTQSSASDGEEITYIIERSVDDDDHFESIAEITSYGYLDVGLDNSETYYYKVKAKDTAGATSAASTTVSDIPEGRYTTPPEITSGPTVTPDSFSANVTWETERNADSHVEYGLTQEFGEEQGTIEESEKHTVVLEGLESKTTYYYRIRSRDQDGNVALSSIATFTTLEAPRVSEVVVSDVKLFDALITWTTNKPTTTKLDYGTAVDYGFTVADTSGSLTTTHTMKLASLTDGTTYHFRPTGLDSTSNSPESSDYSFTTLTFPKVLSISFENKSEGQTEISWTTNVLTTSEVEYYNSSIAPKTQGNSALVTTHSILLFGLEDATAYQFKTKGFDQFGYQAVSEVNTFTTLEDTTPPVITGIQSESNTIGAGETSSVQIIVNWKTNEPTTSQAEFGVGLSGTEFTEQTEANAELVMDHLVVISELAPAKTYRFRVVAVDKAGNESKSGSYSVLTSRKRESFLQLVISNLEETFAWVGQIGLPF